jgi:hypothetical protein
MVQLWKSQILMRWVAKLSLFVTLTVIDGCYISLMESTPLRRLMIILKEDTGLC